MKFHFAASAVLCLTGISHAGPLTPPGAPASTMKTLDEVEARTPIHKADMPLTISQPGSFYLAEPVTITTAATAITITTSGVTIDLNGFSLRGPDIVSNSINGIRASGVSDIVIKNGSISNWPASGISLFAERCRIQDISSFNNRSFGILIWTGAVVNCTAEFNGDAGIVQFGNQSFSANLVTGCTSSHNESHGIRMNQPGLVADNACASNGSSGIAAQADGSVVRNNYCSTNAGAGIIVPASAPGCLLLSNNCQGNTAEGINVLAPDCRVEGNAVSQNDTGLRVSGDSLVIKNSARSNTTNNYLLSATVTRGPTINMPAGGEIASTNPWANISY